MQCTQLFDGGNDGERLAIYCRSCVEWRRFAGPDEGRCAYVETGVRTCPS